MAFLEIRGQYLAGLAVIAAIALPGCNALVSREAYDRDLAGMKQQADWLEEQKKTCQLGAEQCRGELEALRGTAQTAVREREQCKDELANTKKVLDQCTSRGGNCAKDLADCQLAKLKADDDVRRAQLDLQAAKRERDQLIKEQKALSDALARVQDGIKRVQDRLKKLVAAGKLRIRSRQGLLVIEVNSDILFDTGKAEVKAAAKPVLAEIAAAIKDLSDRRFQVAGHTDDTGADALNWRLSTDRALAVLTEMIGLGVPSKAVSAAGFGPFLPMVANDSAENRAKNRRVELLLIPDLGALFEPTVP
jgi:chemotaxis protein MotB